MTKPSRKSAPEALAPVPFNVPQPFITSLDNGLRLVIFDDKRLPLVSFRLAFLTGDASDPVDRVGVTSALASMLNEGTLNYSSRELAERIERLGANVSASSSEDFLIVSASSLSIYSAEILEILAEVVLRPAFPEAELELYKRNTIENLKFQRSQPNFLANEQTARILYGDHPYSRISPSAADIEKLTRDALSDAHENFLRPDAAILIAVGDIEKDEFVNEVEQQFGIWTAGLSSCPHFPKPEVRTERSLTIVDRPGSAQANIVLANLAFPRNHRDYFPALVMNQVLGAGASSRVFMNLREEKGYTYGAYTRLDTKKLAGDFEATAEVRTQVTGDSLREFFFELERIRDERVSENELADAKNFLTGVFPIRAETQEGLTNLIVNQQLYDLPSDFLQTYRSNIEAVTAEDVERVARKYVLPEAMSIVIVGDASEVLPQARIYSENIRVVDTEGREQDLSRYEPDDNAETAHVAGRWELTLDFQGQSVPVQMNLDQDGERISGEIETAMGGGSIKDAAIRGRKLNATATTEIQGEPIEIVINGAVDGDKIQGTLSAAIIPDSLPFEGRRLA